MNDYTTSVYNLSSRTDLANVRIVQTGGGLKTFNMISNTGTLYVWGFGNYPGSTMFGLRSPTVTMPAAFSGSTMALLACAYNGGVVGSEYASLSLPTSAPRTASPTPSPTTATPTTSTNISVSTEVHNGYDEELTNEGNVDVTSSMTLVALLLLANLMV
jgi:hypothetical protein